MSKQIFALDIGTRKVMGIIARQESDGIHILEVETLDHVKRPMFDGQIHSIEEVVKTVKQVKENLEARINAELEQVGVAVAGRNLVTYKSKVAQEFGSVQEVTQEMVRGLELEAVDKIVCDSGKNLSQYYCVGYSPVYYELDAVRIANLVGHQAKAIACEIIVTFLPRVVLDSMFAVLKKSGLEPTNITLEPIAAINAIVPEEMRRLNIILVDIGAGTSDLALTRDGYVFAYGMVAEAGDEITESVSETLLADFAVAEAVKRQMNENPKIEYQDIWGRPRSVDTYHLQQDLLPAVRKLAKAIGQQGLDLNEGKPQAVVVVGGGSLTPGLLEELADAFDIPADKAGIRLPSAIKDLIDTTAKLTGPEAITPIGITLMSIASLGLKFIDIEVNGEKIKVLDFQQKKDIMGALTISGILNNKKLYARPGMALSVEVNTELKIIKGTFGVPAKVLLNGKDASSLSDKIENNDRIEFQEAIDGRHARAQLKDLVLLEPVAFNFNREGLEIYPPVLMNKEPADLNAEVFDRAVIETRALTAGEVLKYKGVDLESLVERQILVNINGTPRILTQRNFTLQVNGKSCDLATEIRRADSVEFIADTQNFYRIKDIIDMPEGFDRMRVSVDGKDIDITIEPVQVFMNGQQVKAGEFLIDGADIRVYYANKRRVFLSDIFKYIEFDPYKGVGKRIKILVDDNPAGFTTPLVDGSRVKIIFEEREE